MKPTIFNISLEIRISKDESHNDKFTKEFILTEILNGNVKFETNKIGTVFLHWTKNYDQIMGVLESMHLK